MTSASSREIFLQRHGGQYELRFVNFPLRDEGLGAWLMVAFFVTVAVISGYLSESPLMGGVVFAALALSAHRLWVPTHYEITAAGVTEIALGRKYRIAWSQVARYEPRRRGVLLSAVAEKTPLAAFRSRYIYCRKHRDELVEAVEHHLGVEARPGSLDSTATMAQSASDEPAESKSV